jgi:hypothetical protein
MGRTAYLASQNRVPTAAEWESEVRSTAGGAQLAIGALDAQGRWVTNGVLRSSVFNANAQKIIRYLRALRGLSESLGWKDR